MNCEDPGTSSQVVQEMKCSLPCEHLKNYSIFPGAHSNYCRKLSTVLFYCLEEWTAASLVFGKCLLKFLCY